MKKFAYDLLSWLEDGAACWTYLEVGGRGETYSEVEGDIGVGRYVLQSENFGLHRIASLEDELFFRIDVQQVGLVRLPWITE